MLATDIAEDKLAPLADALIATRHPTRGLRHSAGRPPRGELSQPLGEPVRLGSFRPQLRCRTLPRVLAQQNPPHNANGDGPNRSGAHP